MCDSIQIQLKTTCILNIPLQTYCSDFTFIVNGKEFKTSRLISDLLSPKICKIHINDPLLSQFTINTKHQGDFSHILQLLQFDIVNVPTEEIEFIYEVLKILENESIDLTKPISAYTLTLENVLFYLKQHELFESIYKKEIENDINFIATHFFEFSETQKEEFLKLNEDTISRIIRNENLRLKDEDEILIFINKLYKIETKYENLYEEVIFSNVSSSSMIEFINLLDFNDMSIGTWSSVSNRLTNEIIEREKIVSQTANRYSKTGPNSQISTEKIKTFDHDENQEFNGIINYLTKKTNGNIHDNGTILVECNSINCDENHPKNLLDQNKDNFYHSKGPSLDIWISFYFKNMEIEISSYTLKSSSFYSKDRGNFKNWVLEVSNDGKNWTKIDEHSNNSDLNGCNITKNFTVKPNNYSRYCRLHQNGDFWGYNGGYSLKLGCIEFYGKIKEE